MLQIFWRKKEKEIVVGKIELSELILISKIDSSELALLAMLLDSQSNPSYSPSPEVAHVLWMYLRENINNTSNSSGHTFLIGNTIKSFNFVQDLYMVLK